MHVIYLYYFVFCGVGVWERYATNHYMYMYMYFIEQLYHSAMTAFNPLTPCQASGYDDTCICIIVWLESINDSKLEPTS